MSISDAGQITESDPQTSDKADVKVEQQRDYLLPSLFVAAAAIILAIQDPINIQFEPRPLLTYSIVGVGVVLLAIGLWRRILPLLFVGTGILFLSIAAGVITQPAQFNVPILAVWPLRLALVLLVICAWAFLMSPVRWLRRALIAFVIPTAIMLLFWGGPPTATQLFPQWARGIFGQIYPPFLNFQPYWLALDSTGRLYATDNDGSIVWVFDSTGNPVGTILPLRAPPVPTPGPGILPAGYENEMYLPGTGLLGTPTPVGGNVVRFEFCGLAVDPQDNLYMMDLTNQSGSQSGFGIMRYDRDGNITARWAAPTGYEPTSGCLAADQKHIYLSARTGSIYILDYDGALQKKVDLGFQPFGISPAKDGKLIVMGPNVLKEMDPETGAIVDKKLPPLEAGVQIPMLALQSGELLASDHVDLRMVKVDPETGKMVGTVSEKGSWPGQLGAIGGMVQDAQGRIYVADYGNRVIQRFTPDGKVDAAWWAARLSSEEGEYER
jgi:sugar lactone lactonase YvrE